MHPDPAMGRSPVRVGTGDYHNKMEPKWPILLQLNDLMSDFDLRQGRVISGNLLPG